MLVTVDERGALLAEAERLEGRARLARDQARTLDGAADELPDLRVTLTLWAAVDSEGPRPERLEREAVDVARQLRREARELRLAAMRMRARARRDDARAGRLRREASRL